MATVCLPSVGRAAHGLGAAVTASPSGSCSLYTTIIIKVSPPSHPYFNYLWTRTVNILQFDQIKVRERPPSGNECDDTQEV